MRHFVFCGGVERGQIFEIVWEKKNKN